MTVIGACTSGVPEEEVAAKDQEIVRLQGEVSTLQEQLGGIERDAKFWSQMTSLYEPVQAPSMTDHSAFMLPSGVVMALHFDSFNLNEAQNLNWVALGFPGRFCKEDQDALEQQYGEGFTHFHDMVNDTHGSKTPGAEGIWFIHSGVRSFDSPMSNGQVSPGVDHNFMPTPPPVCQA